MNDEQPTQSQEVESTPAVSPNGTVAEEPQASADAGANDVTQAPEAMGATGASEIAGEANETQERDDQDAQLPGVIDMVGANEAEPQIMQASETSQAEGEAQATAELPGADTVQPSSEAAAVSAVSVSTTPDTEAGAGGAGEAGEGGEEMVIHSARDPRLEDIAPNASMEDLLKASEQQYRTLKHGDVIEGTVMKLGRDEILVDIGAKTEGIIPSHELQSLSPEERDAMQVGDPVLVSVVQPENNEGHSVLSLDRARQERSWRDLQKTFDAGEIIQAKVSGHNKGGLLVNLEGVRGFVPSSQITSMPAGEANKQAEMARLQNQTLSLKIIEINRNRNRLILSERQAAQERREGERTRLLQELQHGQIRQGKVSSICDFGAFVDIGGADGLIHLSELSWKRVSNPRDVLKEGDVINVYVLSVDPNERKIALSLKRTQPEPWTTITENYHLGQIVRGTITQLTTFGAFARLEDGIEGLIHVSELAEGRVAHPKNVVKEGDVLDLKVIRIDPAKRRIGLSLKRVNEDAEGGSAGAGAAAGEEAEGMEGGERPMSQTDLTEAHSEEGREAEAQAEHPAQPQSQPSPQQAQQQGQGQGQTQPRQQQQSQPRQPQPPRQQQQSRQNAPASSEEGEPMGALAQALSAHLRAGSDEEEETPAPTAAPAQPRSQAPVAATEVATEPETAAAPEPAAQEAEQASAEAEPEAQPQAEAAETAATEPAPQAEDNADMQASDDANASADAETDDDTTQADASTNTPGEAEDSDTSDDTTDSDAGDVAEATDAADTDVESDITDDSAGDVETDTATDSDQASDVEDDADTDTAADIGTEESSFATDDSIESGDMPTEDEMGGGVEGS